MEKLPVSDRTSAHLCATWLRPGFENDVEWGLRSAADALKTGGLQDFRQAAFPRLGAKSEADFLGERSRGAEHGGSSVKDTSDGVQIVFELVVCEGLDDHPSTIRIERLKHVPCRSLRISHIVEAIEESNEVIPFSGKILSVGDFEF
jgi:hypothetical protein